MWDWSQDGKYILTFLPGGDIGYLDVSGDGPYEPQRLRATKHREGHAQFSADGRFVAFQADDDGRWEIYVCSFPDCLDQKKVSLNGGMYPRWAKKQGSLYFRRGKEDLMEVSIRTEPELAVGVPRRLFSNPHLYQQGVVGTRLCDVSDDGERFVVVQAAASRMSPEDPAVIHVWQNWAAGFVGRRKD